MCSIKIRKKKRQRKQRRGSKKKEEKTAVNHPIFLSSHIGIIHQSKEMLRRTSKVKRRKKIEEIEEIEGESFAVVSKQKPTKLNFPQNKNILLQVFFFF